jgi:saccharopine dehydrogenase (NADP+, L-glutamate forming)
VKIDHLYAIKTIEETHAAGGKVLSFVSYCGGLPAAECSDNPLGYKARCPPLLYISLDPFLTFKKFSWSSRGVLLALRNAASFYQGGKIVSVAGPDLMATAKPYFTGYPGMCSVERIVD